MSASADRKPSLLSWTTQHQADIAAVDQSFAEAATIFGTLIGKPLKDSPALRVNRGYEVDMPSAIYGKGLQIIMFADGVDVFSAPEGMQRLFLDLGLQRGDAMDIRVAVARRKRFVNRDFTEKPYVVTLMPTRYEPDLFGLEFSDQHQLWLLKSGTPVEQPEPPFPVTNRYHELVRFFNLMREGMVSGSHEEGTQGSTIVYDHKPHPYLAAIHRATADWITTLVGNRMAR